MKMVSGRKLNAIFDRKFSVLRFFFFCLEEPIIFSSVMIRNRWGPKA